MTEILLYGLLGLIFYQAYVTVRLVQSKALSKEQKWRQALFIWAVPFIGAGATLALLDTDKEKPAPEKDPER